MEEIHSHRFMAVRDAAGQQVKIGAGITTNGRLALLGPPDGVGYLAPAQVPAYMRLLGEAFNDAVGPQ